MSFRNPSGSNTFSIQWDSTSMLVAATRDPGKFKLAKYCDIKNVKNRVFRYLKLDLDEPARIQDQNGLLWAPGQDRKLADNVGAFTYVDSSTVKYQEGWVLPNEAVDQAEWDLQSSQMGIVKQKIMTNRVMLVASLAQTSSNWASTNTDTASNLNAGAGKFDTASSDPSSANYAAIRKALQKACTTIVLQTNAVLQWRDVNLVVSPYLANKMGVSSEILDYVKGSPDAFARQKGENEHVGEFGLPSKYMVDIVVEDAVKVTSKPNITTGLGTSGTRAWVWDDATPVLLAKKGSVDGQFGGQPPSTVQLYCYREMEVWTKNNTDHERMEGSVVDDCKAVLPYSQSGFCITAAL